MKLAVLGCGNMGRALIEALAARGDVQLTVWDSSPGAREHLPRAVKVADPAGWADAGLVPDALVLAVKPQDCAAAIAQLCDAGSAMERVLWISIAAGLTLTSLQNSIGPNARICRVMPNTPALVGMGAAAYCVNTQCTPADSAAVETIFSACGTVVAVPEKLMNAVTGLSGSGPAYVFMFIEALIDGGVAAGLPFDTARALAVQTVRGAAQMLADPSAIPAQLRARVTSPGGTTARGICALEENRFRFAVMDAVAAATRRAEELSKN